MVRAKTERWFINSLDLRVILTFPQTHVEVIKLSLKGMRKLFVIILLSLGLVSNAQTSIDTQYAEARTFMMGGDFSNAIAGFNKIIKENPQFTPAIKDLCFTYILRKDYVNAHNTISPLIQKDDVDEETYQLMGMVYKSLDEFKKAEKMYKAALKKFPNSGTLYNEYGEMYAANSQPLAAIKMWEKGIEVDANYSGNYYNAAKYYINSKDKIWSIIYGEIFLNLESYSRRTAEIKSVLYNSYKKFYSLPETYKDQNTNNKFVKLMLDELANFSSKVQSTNLTTSQLIEIRKKIAENWENLYKNEYPFRLFQYHIQLIKDNNFEAYNHWLFGEIVSNESFEEWQKNNPEKLQNFETFQRGRVFKLPEGEYYQILKK